MANVSEAVVPDVAQLCGLLEILFAQEAEFMPDRAAQARGLAMIIGSPDTGRILVLRDGEKVIGMVNLLFSVSTALGARVAVLEDVVVLPDYRGRGFGAKLVEAAIECAKANGCRRITLLTDADNRIGQALYARHGFKPSEMLPMRLFI
jgi:GNAT superfamily N-acetyltransferase